MKISTLIIAPLFIAVAQASLVDAVGGQENSGLERRQRGGPRDGPRGLRHRALNTLDHQSGGRDKDGEAMRPPRPEFDRGRLAPPPGGKAPPPRELEFLPPPREDLGVRRDGSKDGDRKSRLPIPPKHQAIKGVPPPRDRELKERQLPPNRRSEGPPMPVVPTPKMGGRPPPPPQRAALRPLPPGPMPKLPPPPNKPRGLETGDRPTTLLRQVRSAPTELPDIEILRRSIEFEVYGELL
ncbi:hypothetical protein TWF506_000334 [Arthrobotrys conoides]|uniref:Uncharacterized protein n=1 Tax=Arthrobotrys conoides TaxID=74498 RepID=A0AAN8NDN9_9PEZI